MTMTSSSSEALLSQELFDETVLENEECFDLSPDDALRETVDQFCQQLGVAVAVAGDESSLPPQPSASSTSVAANLSSSGTPADDATPTTSSEVLSATIPAVLSHLILTHPNSPAGQNERSNRTSFQTCLNLLDGCVNVDGTVNFSLNDGDGVTSSFLDPQQRRFREKILQALDEIGKRCRLGEGAVIETKNDNDNHSNTASNNETNGRGNISSNPLPYLAIFQRASSIYTLMSFLSIFNPATSTMEKNHVQQLEVLKATTRTLSSILSITSNTNEDGKCTILRAELRDFFIPALGRLVMLVGGVVSTIHSTIQKQESEENASTSLLLVKVCCDLLQLGTKATRGCEGGKVAFVQSTLSSELQSALFSTVNDIGSKNNGSSAISKRGGVAILVAVLSLGVFNSTQLHTEACHLLASLCRYDDFRDPSALTSGAMGATGVNTSSAHDHAMEFHRAGASVVLVKVARGVLSKLEGGLSSEEHEEEGRELNSASVTSRVTNNERLAAAVLTALRVLAVNDEIIQTMVALGVLPIVTRALQMGVVVEIASNNTNKQRLSAASLGLLRNLCGNDEIKTNLCLGSESSSKISSMPSILPYLLQCMRLYPNTSLIQEHACGTLAAMALRRPANARAILDAEGPKNVILGMRKHEGNVNVQRQGALAVRNIVSRLLRDLPEDDVSGSGVSSAPNANHNDNERSSIRDAFLELGAEDVLRNIAGRHQGSVDEAYAALRDLGCTVSLVKFNANDLQNGNNSRQGTLMFGGKHNSNFRQVYEESKGLEEGVDTIVSQFGA